MTLKYESAKNKLEISGFNVFVLLGCGYTFYFFVTSENNFEVFRIF